MVQVKKMNESFFAKILKEFNVAGELIRARQEEKQGLLDDFDSECKRFFFGKISERALASSVKKTNAELQRLDRDLRTNITKSRRAAEKSSTLVSAQAPVRYRATLSGIVGGEGKAPTRKKKKKKAVEKKKAVKKKRVAKKKKRRTTRKKKK